MLKGKTIDRIFLFIIFVICAWRHVSMAHVYGCEDNFVELILSFHLFMGSGD